MRFTSSEIIVYMSLQYWNSQRTLLTSTLKFGLVDSVFHLPDRSVEFHGKMFEEMQITELL